jgi:hypothetical protein
VLSIAAIARLLSFDFALPSELANPIQQCAKGSREKSTTLNHLKLQEFLN